MQSFNPAQQQVKIRNAVLIFLKSTAAPIVLYVDNSEEIYAELQSIIKNASSSAPKLIEKLGKGPLKKVCILDSQISGVAIQEEPYLQ